MDGLQVLFFADDFIRNFGWLVFCGNLVPDRSAVLYYVDRASGGPCGGTGRNAVGTSVGGLAVAKMTEYAC